MKINANFYVRLSGLWIYGKIGNTEWDLENKNAIAHADKEKDAAQQKDSGKRVPVVGTGYGWKVKAVLQV